MRKLRWVARVKAIPWSFERASFALKSVFRRFNCTERQLQLWVTSVVGRAGVLWQETGKKSSCELCGTNSAGIRRRRRAVHFVRRRSSSFQQTYLYVQVERRILRSPGGGNFEILIFAEAEQTSLGLERMRSHKNKTFSTSGCDALSRRFIRQARRALPNDAVLLFSLASSLSWFWGNIPAYVCARWDISQKHERS